MGAVKSSVILAESPMLSASQVVDKYFLETRCMLIEIAAMLDRCERARATSSNGQSKPDDRLELIRQSLKLLAQEDAGPNRSEQLLLLFTDPNS